MNKAILLYKMTNYISVSYTIDCSNVNIVSRDSWGARRPKSTSYMTTPVKDFFIHHTAGGSCTSFSSCVSQVKGIQNYHMDNKSKVKFCYK